MRRALGSFCVLSLALVARAQDPPVACRICQNHGSAPCARHGRQLAQEQAPLLLHCSVVAECKACEGALAVDCKQCANPTAEGELARRRQLARDWLATRRKTVDAVAAREPFHHLATTHYELAVGLKPATIGKEKFDTHARTHVYGERLQALRALFVKTFELTDADLPDRMTVVLSEEAKDHALLGPKLTGIGTANSVGLKLMGPEYVYSMWNDKRALPDDEAVHRNVVHNVAHLLLSQMQPAMFLGNHHHGWIDEGVAHWFEDAVVGKCTNFCFEEILMLSPASFKGGKWRPAVRKLLDDGKAPPFASFAGKNTDELNYVEHAFAFAAVDWLLAAHGGGKFRDFVRLLKRDQATRDALQQVYGLSPITFDPPFHAWLKEHYSPLQER
jgi:hypothetical protein